FLRELLRQLHGVGFDRSRHADWLAWWRGRGRRYPPPQSHQRKPSPLNPYHFPATLFVSLAGDDAVLWANGSTSIMSYQVARLRGAQRLITNSGSASLGYELPAAIGAAFARPGKRVACLAGDGSIQFNLQELQTIVHHNLPIKIFMFNNG